MNEQSPSLLTPGSCTAFVCGGLSVTVGRGPFVVEQGKSLFPEEHTRLFTGPGSKAATTSQELPAQDKN